ncbi:MAG: hypothetical protein JWN67_2231 [Actinomycetia bacterium]|nr:hypothetical protein [Actinomycetes bacterium]
MTRAGDERGSILVTVLLVSVVLAVIGGSLLRGTFADLDQGQLSQATNRSLQAAEAGINDYIAKLTEDHLYYAHWVHRAEATRVATGTGIAYDPGATVPLKFDGTLKWTYPNGRDGWLDLGDGLEYDLQVFPPTATRTTVRLVATGRRTGVASSARTLEALVRTASIADFQMISNAEVIYGPTATANGKIYAGNGSNIVHAGTVNANLYAEGHIYRTKTGTSTYSGTPTYSNGSRGYDATTIRTVIPTAIDFDNFTGSVGDVQRAAAAATDGITLNDPTAAGWWLKFQGNGTVTMQRCTAIDLSPAAPINTLPTCGTATSKPVPTNGAIYAAQDVIVSGTVSGRVTVATTGDIVVGGNVDYASSGWNVDNPNSVDVLGLMAQDEVLVPRWAPNDLTWRAGTIAMEQQWRSAAPNTTHGTMTFYGSTATNLGGYMSQYAVRSYNYDSSLLFLQPPYFPVLEDAYTIQLLREIT